ncbi:hypothetical protein [Streptomyces sp. NPDC093984]|uniref:hypothetical protein n=1 Tax=Streptomyces sp. NPDC093984 TaxID=3366052 RepID=UPI00380A8BFD
MYQAGRDQLVVNVHGRVLLAVLGLVGTIVVSLVLVKTTDAGTGGDDSGRQAATGPAAHGPGTTSSTPSPPADEDSSPPASSPAPAPTAVQWSGPVTLTFLDLDSVPPKVLSSNDGASVWVDYKPDAEGRGATLYGLRGDLFSTQSTIAQWQSPAKPSRRECSERISTQATDTLPVTTGDRYCVKTAAGRIALVTVGGFNRATDAFGATVDVWAATT